MQANIDPAATHLSGQINLSLSEKVSALTGLRPKTLKIAAITAVAIPVVVFGAVFANYQLRQNKTVLSVGEYKINQRTYDKLIAEAAAINQNRGVARQNILEGLAARAAADKLNVRYDVSEGVLNEQVRGKDELSFDAAVSEYQRLTVTKETVNRYVHASEIGGYEAAVLEFPFSRYVIGSPTGSVDSKKVGDNKEISSDMSYAEAAYKKYQPILEQRKSSPEKAVESVKADKRLIYGQTSNPSGVLLLTDPGQSSELANEVDAKLWKDVQAAAQNPGKTYLSEVLFAGNPAAFGVDFPGIVRGKSMQAGWRLTYLIHKYEKQQGITDKYEGLVKEYKGV